MGRKLRVTINLARNRHLYQRHLYRCTMGVDKGPGLMSCDVLRSCSCLRHVCFPSLQLQPSRPRCSDEYMRHRLDAYFITLPRQPKCIQMYYFTQLAMYFDSWCWFCGILAVLQGFKFGWRWSATMQPNN